jgi:hypothetical protein
MLTPSQCKLIASDKDRNLRVRTEKDSGSSCRWENSPEAAKLADALKGDRCGEVSAGSSPIAQSRPH